MDMRSVGIIGCGWLGSALGSSLAAAGCRVVGTTTTPDKREELRDLGIEPAVMRFGGAVDPDPGSLADVDVIVVTLPPSRESDAVGEAAQVARVIRLTRAGHVIQISTSSVYPSTGGRVVEDDAVPDHRLVLVEDELRALDCKVTILRCTGLYGPGRLILPYVLSSGRAVDPDAPVNLVEQNDVVRAVRRVIEEPVSDTFNICADEHPTRGEFYREIARRSGMGVPEFRPSGEPWKIVDNAKFRERFGFRYEYPDPLQFPV